MRGAVRGGPGRTARGANAYHGQVERRPEMGDGRAPGVGDVRRAVRLSGAVTSAAAVVCAALAWWTRRTPPRREGAG
ncbi:hypothetical protein [Actinomadura sp. J1-007]|uniref:hypothetical protein n=1 Tax=Actinomadura sp. J1-007 TaxID=2661913 RepID=UPI001F4FB803|nr:hypothetical protein [Actinomadura sp. J1-007]